MKISESDLEHGPPNPRSCVFSLFCLMSTILVDIRQNICRAAPEENFLVWFVLMNLCVCFRITSLPRMQSFIPRIEVQVELPDHLTSDTVLHAVQSDIRMPDGGSVHQLEGQAQQLLIDVQQTLSHHLHRKVLLQQVLIHGVLSLLHLIGEEEEEINRNTTYQMASVPLLHC